MAIPRPRPGRELALDPSTPEETLSELSLLFPAEVVANPNASLDLIKRVMLRGRPREQQYELLGAIARNPMLPLTLLTEPGALLDLRIGNEDGTWQWLQRLLEGEVRSRVENMAGSVANFRQLRLALATTPLGPIPKDEPRWSPSSGVVARDIWLKLHELVGTRTNANDAQAVKGLTGVVVLDHVGKSFDKLPWLPLHPGLVDFARLYSIWSPP